MIQDVFLKVVSLEKQLGDQKKTATKNAKELEEKMANMTHRMEEKFATDHGKLVDLDKIVTKHEGKINEMQDKGKR